MTGLVLMAALDVLARRARLESFSTGWATAYYFLILALPTGMVLAAGLWPAVLVTLAGVAVAGGITVFARGASSPAGVVGAPSTAGAQ